MEAKQLYNGEWINLVSWNNYEFVDEASIVLVVLIRKDSEEVLYGIREEYCPPYFYDSESPDSATEELYYTLITGGIEEGEDAEDALYREIEEEAGIQIVPGQSQIIALSGSIPMVKFASTQVYPFVVNLEPGSFKVVEAIGDGTENEKKSKTSWVTAEEVNHIIEEGRNFDFFFLFLKYLIEYPR